MIDRRTLLSGALASAAYCRSALGGSSAQPIEGRTAPFISGRSVAATVHPLASLAAVGMIERGGNAIDAATAAALCLGVVDGHNSGIGGGCLILLRLANGETHAIDGRETAPRRAHKDMYLRNGTGNVTLSQDGPLACGVPGQIAALHLTHERFGQLPWQDLFEPAIRAAREGIDMPASVSASIKNELKTLVKFPSSAKVLLQADGKPLETGQRFVQKDLAMTLEKIAIQGVDWFYQGEFADRCSQFLKTQGGIMDDRDFRDYRAKERSVLNTKYRGRTVLGFPPPSSGGMHIAQMLQILSTFSIKEVSESGRTSGFYHLLAEAMKLAFADRAHYLGDSDFVEVPSFLITRDYTDELAKKIDLSKASKVPGHLLTTASGLDDDKKHTTHFSVADRLGNWVSLTATVNTSWGSKIIVPGTGVMLNNEMDDFSISPGVPNAFGLIGSEANAVAPGKRPLSSMSPTIVLDADGSPMLACGAAGGPRIINATLQTIIRCMDYDMPIADALRESRIHHQWQPDSLFCEGSIGGVYRPGQTNDKLLDELKSMGHNVKTSGALAVAQGIKRLGGTNVLEAACDPRAGGRAAGTES